MVPAGLSPEDDARLRREQSDYIISEIWTKTPHPLLRRRTPLQAAQAGDSETFLRASIRRMEAAYDSPEQVLDWNELRARLRVSAEPPIDPETVEFDTLHLSRVPLVPIDRLNDERLVALYRFSVKWGLRRVRNQVSRLLDERPSLLATAQIDVIKFYGELALEAAQEGEREQAETWLEKGKQFESRQKRSGHSLRWELVGLQVKMILDPPDVWVPVLAVMLDRCRGNQEATSKFLLRTRESRSRPGRRRSQTARPVDPGHSGPGTVSQTIWPTGDDGHGRAGSCGESGRNLDAGIFRHAFTDLDAWFTCGFDANGGEIEAHPARSIECLERVTTVVNSWARMMTMLARPSVTTQPIF